MEEKMQEKLQTQDEISLMDIVRLFIRKLKIIILVALVALIAGAAFGYSQTYGRYYYGTNKAITIFINPQKEVDSLDSNQGIFGSYSETTMETLIKQLSSEKFAERLMLDDDGLPYDEMITKIRNNTSNKNAEAIANELTQKIATARAELLSIGVLESKLEKIDMDVAKARSNAYTAQQTVNNAWADLGRTGTPTKIVNPVTEAESNYNQAWESYYDLKLVYEELSRQQTDANSAVRVAKNAQYKLSEEILETWRKNYPGYSGSLSQYRSAVTYSYRLPSEGKDVKSNNHIYISIEKSGSDDAATKKFAVDLLDKIIKYVPSYIEEILPPPSNSFVKTSCEITTTTHAIQPRNQNVAKNTAIKYAIILTAIAVVVTCVVIIIIDRSDKRLRSVEQITDKFNLPVLGIIPNIHIDKDKNTTEDDK